jgi:hypothetical protein
MAKKQNRRTFLKAAALGLGAVTLGGALPALSHSHDQGHGHGHGHEHGHGHGGHRGVTAGRVVPGEIIPAQPAPWENGICDFCGMTLATPENDPRGAGFREQTYAQIALAGGSALHFESIACMFNYAYVHGIRDGDGATFYVTDRASFNFEVPKEGKLVMARDATFYWGEQLMVVMDARLLAFAKPDEAQAFAEAHPEHGRQRLVDIDWLIDFAPLPEMNLISLLALHAGLIE